MLVLVTGAAGFVGQAVVKELLENGHQVVGLARSDTSAEVITKTGAEVRRGDIEDLGSLRSAARDVDGVIHLAFVHDFSDFPRACAVDRAAIQTIAEAVAGSGKPLVIASGTMGFPEGELGTEDTEPMQGPGFLERAKSETLLFKLSEEKQLRGIALRLTPSVHGAGDKGFVSMFIDAARKNKAAVYVNDGSARWPAVHRADAAVLFRLALEKGASGKAYHAVAEQGITMKEIMGTIGKRLQLPVEGKSVEEAATALGWFAQAIAGDHPASSEKTKRELGWQPTQPGLIADMEANYFA